MKNATFAKIGISFLLFVGLLLISPKETYAHCDTLDGPVISAARNAIKTGNPNFVLIWVKKEDEDKLLKAFREAMARKEADGDPEDIAFFEEFVKIHREGEGAQYTGLKPAGLVEPEVAAADKALEEMSFTTLSTIIPKKSQDAIHNNLHTAIQLRSYDRNDVEAGRKFVASYVTFVHNVERAVKGEELIADGESHHHESPLSGKSTVQKRFDASVSRGNSSLWQQLSLTIESFVRNLQSIFG